VLTVICPSRGRPEAAAEVVATFLATAIDLDTKLVFVVDPDDESADRYPGHHDEPFVYTYQLDYPSPGNMNAALGRAIAEKIGADSAVVGFIGDDHRFRTEGWDAAIEDFLETHPGIAYADDLFQRERLPTNWFVSRPIVDAFGMGLPALKHLYIDDYWKALGSAAGCFYYMPELVIEHMHPLAGKGEWDDGYRRVNDPSVYTGDGKVFHDWVERDMDHDVERLKAIIA
jgi:hypothetical protein